MSELKRCPFCGHEAMVKLCFIGGYNMPRVECTNCFASSQIDVEDNVVIKSWNKRVNYARQKTKV